MTWISELKIEDNDGENFRSLACFSAKVCAN
jgi:hypothetical protein